MHYLPAFILLMLVNTGSLCQSTAVLAAQQAFQDELLTKYKKLKAKPEDRARLDQMKVLPFFPFDSTFRVRAQLDTSGSSGFQGMKTSLGRVALYRRFGNLSFTVAGTFFKMPVYQGKSEADAGSDELFFPFTDLTNGEATYGGGRYIDLHIPKGKELTLDFNRAFNPYCAYSHLYSCEIPPEENNFQVKIEAGVKYAVP